MSKFSIIKKSSWNKKLIWSKLRCYIDFIILICCLIVTFNIRQNTNNESNTADGKMIYIFHDYNWNEYILNDETIHWTTVSLDYLFDDEVPDSIKAGDNMKYSVSLWDTNSKTNSEGTDNNKNDKESDALKDNQVSFEEVIADLWLEFTTFDDSNKQDDTLIINLSEASHTTQESDNYYTIKEEIWNDGESSLIIENSNDDQDDLSWAKSFTFTSEWWTLPSLSAWDELSLKYSTNHVNNDPDNSKIKDYDNCMTPWWYTISHWESVLAYQQTDIDSDICNIERRFCWKWRLSGSYKQQWCYTNKTYTHREWWEDDIVTDVTEDKSSSDKTSSTTTKPLWTGSFVFDRPSQASTPEYHLTDNVRPEDEEVSQTKRPHPWCTAPWWEKVKHGMFVQAFKHSNWFNDAPCEAQIRLCSMWELMWSYTQSTCKPWDTSFIDWINWSPTRETYSKEKLERVKQQIIDQQINYDKWLRRFSNSDELEKILNILDS